MFSVFIFCQGYERAQNYSLAYCDLRLQVFLHDIVVHHETAADVGDDGVRLMKTEVFVDFDGVKILFVDGEIDCGELFRLTERFDEIERRRAAGRGCDEPAENRRACSGTFCPLCAAQGR